MSIPAKPIGDSDFNLTLIPKAILSYEAECEDRTTNNTVDCGIHTNIILTCTGETQAEIDKCTFGFGDAMTDAGMVCTSIPRGTECIGPESDEPPTPM